MPLVGACGYSLTIAGGRIRPRRALYLAGAKVGISSYEDSIRIAGVFEFGRSSGVRPVTTDGLPLIGGAPALANVYVATGHGMLGVTRASATAAVLAPLVLEGRTAPEILPFEPTRTA